MRVYKPAVVNLPLRYFSLCSGIGVAEKAIHSVYPNAWCVGYAEIDAGAISVYEKHFPEHENYENALLLKAESLPDFDLLIGGKQLYCKCIRQILMYTSLRNPVPTVFATKCETWQL